MPPLFYVNRLMRYLIDKAFITNIMYQNPFIMLPPNLLILWDSRLHQPFYSNFKIIAFMLFPHSKLLFRIELKRDYFSMKTTRLELDQGSFVNDLIQIMSLLLWKIVKRFLCGVQARTRTTKYVRHDLYISKTYVLSKFLHIVKLSISM